MAEWELECITNNYTDSTCRLNVSTSFPGPTPKCEKLRGCVLRGKGVVPGAFRMLGIKRK